MLLELVIENFALIKKLHIDFEKGLNIFTGETGAGKSIMFDAVNMALGERADKSYIRTGASKTVIQMLFSVDNPLLTHLLKDSGIDLVNDHTLILTREIYNNGRSVSRINDRIVTVSLVKEISKYLIDIHGQHAHQSLLYPDNHIDILDSFDASHTEPLKKKIADKFYELKELRHQLNSLCGNGLERERRKDLLRFQLNEIDGCNLTIGEEDELIAQQNLLSNSERLLSIMANAYEKIYHGDGRYLSMIDGLGSIVSDFEHIIHLDPNISSIHRILNDCLYSLDDVSKDIRNYRDSIEFNPKLLEDIEKRLDIINNLKRKYGKDIKEILFYREKTFLELEDMENSEENIEKLKHNIDHLSTELLALSTELRGVRKSIGSDLESRIINELVSLNMNNIVFKVDFKDHLDKNNDPIFTSKGIDKLEFLISTNAGEVPKPLSKIASGGEMSRIMLAFKTILAKTDDIPTLIFDEIDSGISGITANIVGEKLAVISRTHQILCITHLPQIALMADTHYYIEKYTENNATLTNVRRLKEDDRILELGRLLGSITLTDLTIEHAKEMLQVGNTFKNTLLSKK